MRRVALFGIIIIIVAFIWGKTETNSDASKYSGETTVLKVDDQVISVSEAMIHMLLMRENVESKWGPQIWYAQTTTTADGDYVTYEASVKSDVLKELETEKTLGLLAKEKGYKLSKMQKDECMKKAQDQIGNFDSGELITYGITTEKLAKHYRDVELAEMIYNHTMDQFVPKYKEADFNVATLDIFIVSKVRKLSDGTYGTLPEKDCKERLKAAKKVHKALLKGKSIKEIKKNYPVELKKDVDLTSASMNQKAWDTLRSMKKGDVSDIFEMDRGYMICIMKNPDNQKKTRESIQNEIERQKLQAFEEYYKEEYKSEYNIDVEEAIWDNLPLAAGNE